MIMRVKFKGANMPTHLEQLIVAARGKTVSLAEREVQQRSFAYGNTHIENPRITRETVDQQAEALKAKAGQR